MQSRVIAEDAGTLFEEEVRMGWEYRLNAFAVGSAPPDFAE
jgi:hypothetical protein